MTAHRFLSLCAALALALSSCVVLADMVTFGPFAIPEPLQGIASDAPGFSNVITVDQELEGGAYIFRAPKSGTIDTVEFRVGNVGDVPVNGIKVSLQGLSGGMPDGTPAQFRVVTSGLSSGAWVVPGLITSDGTDSGTKRTVAEGDYLAFVLEFASFTAGDDFQVHGIATNTSSHQFGAAQAYMALRNSSGVWSANNSIGNIALKYDDGSYVMAAPNWIPIATLGSASFGSSSTPDERGLRFQVPVSMRLVGAVVRGIFTQASDVVLYDSGGSALATSSFAPDRLGQNYYVPLPATTLSAETTYRLVITPTSASTVTLYHFTVSTTSIMAAVPGGSEWYYTERTDGGAWTDSTTQRPWISLVFDGIDAEGGGGGGDGGEVAYPFIG